ncbi:MAG TPA: GGDEF domain-containing protein [Sphingomicrobium sp.]|nr:GGDEF domain-containing protein [Sphingomicrobium sp.]
MLFGLRQRHPISAAIYLELVRSLLSTMFPTVVIGLLFGILATICSGHVADHGMTGLGLIGSGLAMARLALLLLVRRSVTKRGLDLAGAETLERLFASVYLAFALALGAFAARSFMVSPLADQMAVSALVVGYAAGVAAGVSLRPMIAIAAMLLSVLPAIGSSLFVADSAHRTLSFVFAVLLVGGIASVASRYWRAIEMIQLRHRFASLARCDSLTGLGNRPALEVEFLRAVEAGGGKDVVLHCFDLDHFKPVNDTYGHIVGDQLLQAVAGRLNRLVRSGDIAVRLGGDEFAVLQTGVEHHDESELMARRIARSLAEPYSIDGREIRIGASVGSASGLDHGPDLQRLLSAADDALYAVKNSSRRKRVLAG